LDRNSFLGKFEGMFVSDTDCDSRRLWAIRDDMVKEEIVQDLMGGMEGRDVKYNTKHRTLCDVDSSLI